MATPTTDVRSYRLTNIDMLRGLVIIIMAIDHVRDYFFIGGGVNINQPDIDAGLYLTRWITHFCAPVFVFLAGTSVGLMATRKSSSQIGKFVLKRGIWLVFVEIFVISTAVSFAPFGDPILGGRTLAFLQILWAMGISMIVLSGAQFLGPRVCLMIGIAILTFHNLLDPIWPSGSIMGAENSFWMTLHSQGSFILGPFHVMILYPVIPWIGIIFLGFGSAYIFQKKPAQRDAYLIKVGLSFIALFIIIRFADIYGDPNTWHSQPLGLVSTFFDFMNVTKYPPSLLFALATLGPMAIICAMADKVQGWLKDTLVMFGRVPFAFYVAHFYLIHLLSVLYGMLKGYEASQLMHFFPFYPDGFGINLMGVYLVWILVLVILYPFCKWMAKVKSSRKDWWLSYL